MGKPSSYTRFHDAAPDTRANFLVPAVRRGPTSQPRDHAGSNLFSLPKEPEDARLTGGTRSLDRRLLALNIAGSLGRKRPVPDRVPGSELHTAVA